MVPVHGLCMEGPERHAWRGCVEGMCGFHPHRGDMGSLLLPHLISLPRSPHRGNVAGLPLPSLARSPA